MRVCKGRSQEHHKGRGMYAFFIGGGRGGGFACEHVYQVWKEGGSTIMASRL